LRNELTRSADLLQFLRLMAGASPELAGFAFMCDGGIETTPSERAPALHFEACAPRRQASGRTLLDLPSARAHLVRLPLAPARPAASEDTPRSD
jgi:hypothetical protein